MDETLHCFQNLFKTIIIFTAISELLTRNQLLLTWLSCWGLAMQKTAHLNSDSSSKMCSSKVTIALSLLNISIFVSSCSQNASNAIKQNEGKLLSSALILCDYFMNKHHEMTNLLFKTLTFEPLGNLWSILTVLCRYDSDLCGND